MIDQALKVMTSTNEQPIRIVGTRRQPTDSLQIGKESAFHTAYLFTVYIVLYFLMCVVCIKSWPSITTESICFQKSCAYFVSIIVLLFQVLSPA